MADKSQITETDDEKKVLFTKSIRKQSRHQKNNTIADPSEAAHFETQVSPRAEEAQKRQETPIVTYNEDKPDEL